MTRASSNTHQAAGANPVADPIADAIARIRKAGKAAGILSTNKEQGDKWLAAGAQFVAIGADTMLLHASAKQLVASYRGTDGSVKNTY